MGHSADRLCERFGVSREEQDKFGHRSHMMAAQAAKDENLSDIINVCTIPYCFMHNTFLTE